MSRSKLVLLLAVALTAASCTDTTSAEYIRTGRYTLARINGQALPAQVHETAVARLDFHRGELKLNEDATFTDVTDLKVVPKAANGTIVIRTDTARGTYRFAGDTVFLDSTRDEHYYMVFQSSGSLQQLLGESTLVYRKATF
jgi:hypothetical protein